MAHKSYTETEIMKYLSEHQLYAEPATTADGMIIISIDMGDWKHEHAYCDYLMKQLGFELVKEEVTEDSECDAYSSDHYYKLSI